MWGQNPGVFLILHCCAHLVSFIFYILSFCAYSSFHSGRVHLFCHLGSGPSYILADGHCQSLCLLKYLVYMYFTPHKDLGIFEKWWLTYSEQRLSRYLRGQEDCWICFYLVPISNWLANPINCPNNSSQRNALAFHVWFFFLFWRPRVLFSSRVPHLRVVLDPVVC